MPVAGAFKRFRHEHTFELLDGGTVVRDAFDYTSPFGLVGQLADALFLRRYMTRLLQGRNAYLKQVAESATR